MTNSKSNRSCPFHPGEDCLAPLSGCVNMGRIRVLDDRAVAVAHLVEQCRESALEGYDDALGLPLSAALEAANLLALAISRDVKEVGRLWTLDPSEKPWPALAAL